MINNRLVVILGALSLTFLSTAIAEKKNPVIIFTAAQAQKFGYPQESPFWTPTRRQISLLESQLLTYLKLNPPKYGSPVLAPLNYGRQYLGVTKGDRKVIFLNAFCETGSSDSWREELVMVEDGGSCYFQVYFDPETRKFLELQYNGMA